MKITRENPAMLTDQYEFTMAAAYHRNEMFEPATFSLFIRAYPPNRGYFVSAGLETVLSFLESYRFEDADLDYLKSEGKFSDDFLHYLSGLKFEGEVFAIPEGRLFFKDEPILEVTAPIIQGQLVETFIINAINLQVSIATKATRCVHAARGRGLVDFSLRRTHGMDAGLKVARASWLAGFDGTSNVLAGKAYDIPISGTMAHSFVTSFPDEQEAFSAFAETFPENTVLLIDTYDTVTGAKKAVEVARAMRKRGHDLRGVRLDSGDMAQLSKDVRKILDSEGFKDVKIFASGGFDEFKIADVVDRDCEIDAFGVGTKMGVSADGPYNDIAFKLVQYGDRPVMKLSSGKKTLVGRKQVFRHREGDRLAGDAIGLRREDAGGEAMLTRVMKDGKRQQPAESLNAIRDRFETEFASLDKAYKRLENPVEYPVELAPDLQALQEEVVHEIREKELGES
jgi:nicotinate phosphoribosyltransferase